jgi:hypothetical protein
VVSEVGAVDDADAAGAGEDKPPKRVEEFTVGLVPKLNDDCGAALARSDWVRLDIPSASAESRSPPRLFLFCASGSLVVRSDGPNNPAELVAVVLPVELVVVGAGLVAAPEPNWNMGEGAAAIAGPEPAADTLLAVEPLEPLVAPNTNGAGATAAGGAAALPNVKVGTAAELAAGPGANKLLPVVA